MKRIFFLLTLLLVILGIGDFFLNGSISKFESEKKSLLKKFQTMRGANFTEKKIVAFLMKKAINNLKNDNEYTIYSIIYYGYIHTENPDYVSKICKKVILGIISDAKILSKFAEMSQANMHKYDSFVKVLVLKMIDIFLEKHTTPNSDISSLINRMKMDFDTDIAGFAYDQKLKYEFNKFIEWAKTPLAKRNLKKRPHFSCSFYLRDPKQSSRACYYSLLDNFILFLKKKGYIIIKSKDSSQTGWTKITYLAKSKVKPFRIINFNFESEITPSGMHGYSKIYVNK
jgi:hypothetical protein